LRVLHVMECTIGGTRRHLVDVARGELAEGLDVHVVASTLREPAFEGDLRALELAGAVVERLPMVRAVSPATDSRHMAWLRAHLERTRPDVVHTHSSKAGVLGRLASVQTGIGARVHTPHTFAFLFEAEFGPLKRALYRSIERGLSGHTRAIVAVSPGEARTFAASGVVERERVRVVPNGIDPAPWLAAKPIERSSLSLRGDRPLAAVVGLLNVAKGQDIALDALALPGLEHLQLIVAGHGAMEPLLRERARRLRIEERVRVLGFRGDVPALIAASDFVVVPSRWEGMPYVALEAMAAAKPVVATPVDGSRDLVEHGRSGLLARAIDAASLADAMRAMTAASDAERTRMGRRGRERLLAEFTAQAMVQGLVRVYREAA
jgi:glycosyltransferase involved in cell wall biosynthesis